MFLNDKKKDFGFKFQFNHENKYILTIKMKRLIINMSSISLFVIL